MKKSVVLVVLVACQLGFAKPVETQEELDAIARAHDVTADIKKRYQDRLQKALKKDGVEKSIAECRVDLAESVESGRTSHRLRNPSNAPRDWVKPYLDKYSAVEASKIPKHVLVPLGKGHFGYLEPIFVQPICLNCHGPSIASPVQKALKTAYPEDQAVGFKNGDFRGFFWIEMKAK